ncbi:hypothetical protein Acife_1845 [Acidithiobacillus ferrivorans SS3]|uniref:Uncharacterized protein n=1 Tax=Acidithiobacillus ferrivorans SS3 TaxID=743299 RepID=G0JKX4_9PROT|nr:hypothetical protein Acife_1845 [Acidithiobacillus ferrivorans SS3]OFA16931.1 hypothetical protein A4U49_04850 [Acidithiobacillus ferrivorans]
MSHAEAVIRFFQNTASDYSAGQAVGLPSLGSGMQDYTVLVLRPAMARREAHWSFVFGVAKRYAEATSLAGALL